MIIKHLNNGNDTSYLQKIIDTSYLENKSFFNIDIDNIELSIASDRQKFSKLVGRETKDWEVGCSQKGNKIIILDRNSFEKESSHKIKDFDKILNHEMAHIFTNTKFGYFNPVWLYEGLAGFVSKQYKDRKKTDKNNFVSFTQLFTKEDWNKNPQYSQAYLFTSYLFNRFGREKLFDLMSKIGAINNVDNFEKKFTNITKINFNTCVENWINDFE